MFKYSATVHPENHVHLFKDCTIGISSSIKLFLICSGQRLPCIWFLLLWERVFCNIETVAQPRQKILIETIMWHARSTTALDLPVDRASDFILLIYFISETISAVWFVFEVWKWLWGTEIVLISLPLLFIFVSIFFWEKSTLFYLFFFFFNQYLLFIINNEAVWYVVLWMYPTASVLWLNK